MRSISIQLIGITDLSVDCIVNAANDGLREGGGVCGAIFHAAGSVPLTRACRAIGGCPTGSAVITPGFALKAQYIIHAVGPVWTGGENGEEKLLYSAYRSALALAEKNRCRSIAFPLISAGIFGYPKTLAWRTALQACRDHQREHPDTAPEIIFAVLDEKVRRMGEAELARQEALS